MEEPIIRKSNDNKSHEEIENGVYVYYIPESAYNLYINKGKEDVNRTPEQRKSAIKKIKVKRKQTRDIKEKFKKDIKNKPKKESKEYKGKKEKRYKALAGGILAALAAGSISIATYTEYKKEYDEVASYAENMTNEEISTEIENIIKEEISKATNERKEDIEISQYSADSTFRVTEVTSGDKIYTHIEDLDSPISTGNTLKSKSITKLIDETKEAGDDKRKLIRVLMKAKEFSEEKDLVEDGNTLKEVKDKGDEER